MRRRMGDRVRRMPVAGAVGTVLLALLASGCGIRPTTVPVDAGAAPSRAACSSSDVTLPEPSGTPSPGDGDRMSVDRKVVYLVCNGQVDAVLRGGTLIGSRVEVAGALLAELARRPAGPEEADGYETTVPSLLEVAQGRKRDPEGTLRLSSGPDELQPFALAQIVCTFSYVLSGKAPVLLAGPEDEVRRYRCDTALRTGAESGTEAGTPV